MPDLDYLGLLLGIIALVISLISWRKTKSLSYEYQDLQESFIRGVRELNAEISAYKNYNEVLEISNARLRDAINFMKVRVPDIDMGSVEAIIRGDKIW
jgi:hypothetical protein